MPESITQTRIFASPFVTVQASCMFVSAKDHGVMGSDVDMARAAAM